VNIEHESELNKQALSPENRCQTIKTESGKAFNPGVVDVFVELQLEFWDVRNKMED
jgi:response regulator RpfG family c-di-GMP phosphodiesterase